MSPDCDRVVLMLGAPQKVSFSRDGFKNGFDSVSILLNLRLGVLTFDKLVDSFVIYLKKKKKNPSENIIFC